MIPPQLRNVDKDLIINSKVKLIYEYLNNNPTWTTTTMKILHSNNSLNIEQYKYFIIKLVIYF